jgi:hypothetical protein
MKTPIAEEAEEAEARREKQSSSRPYFETSAQRVAFSAFRARATLARMSYFSHDELVGVK